MEEQYNENNEQLTEAEMLKHRNIAQNANNVRNIADIASKTNNPYAKAAGTAVKAADKLTGGKSSETLGKVLNNANKITPGGMLAQKALNKLGENGTSSRISKAMSKKNTARAVPSLANMKSNAVAEGKEDSFLDRREVEDQTSSGGEVNTKATAKVIKGALIAMPFVLVAVVFLNLIVAGSQTYVKIIGLDQADKVSDAKVEEAIRDEGTKDLDEEITDENANEGTAGDLIGVATDVFIDDPKNFKNLSLIKISQKSNISGVEYGDYGEADLKELEDYYSNINNYKDGSYDMKTVYKFFFKLYYIEKRYKRDYGIGLDMPLIMSVLTIKEDDINEVFVLNTKDYKVSTGIDNPNFSYDVDFSNYKSSKTNSIYDIELLAQNMVTRHDDKTCANTVDRKCYSIDSEKFSNFLRQFLKDKYFINESTNSDDQNIILPNDGNSNSNVTTPAQGDFRSWTQCGQNWSSKKVPNSSKTICKIGCLITSITIQIARSNTITVTSPIDPGVALNYFKFAKGGNLYWASPSNLAPNFEYQTAINLVGLNKAKVAKKLTSYDPNKYYIVLAVSKKNRKSIHHYVALDYVDKNNNSIYIMDPASAKQTDLYEHYKVYKAHIYMKKD